MDASPGQLADTIVARSVVSRWAWCGHRLEHENGYGGRDRRSRSSVRLAIEPVRLRFGADRVGYFISLSAQERFASTT